MSCAVDRCLNERAPGQLMCRKHWYQVPKALRDEVWRTWKAFTNPGRSSGRRGALALAYREAADAATESITHA